MNKAFSGINKDCWGIGEASDNSAVRDFGAVNDCESEDAPMWREFELRPGLRVSAFEAKLSQEYSFSYQKKNDFIDFGFFLEGAVVNNMHETSLGPLRINNVAGSGGLGFFQEMAGVVEFAPLGSTRIIHLHISPELLHELLSADMDAIHEDLKQVLSCRVRKSFFLHHVLDPVVQAAANELFHALVGGNYSRVYLVGKALELIGLQVMKYEGSAVRQGLTPSEIELIRDIRKELTENFDSAPTLAELSGKYSLSVSKIQAGFQELYGRTVFGYLKEFKMRKARMLFEDGDMNVSEVAWALGYTNLSHFSAAFKKRYGVLPKKFLTSVREKKTSALSS
ncbi:helix-turn-helix transcriptional regulator [Maridesulfovibrio salexigens]|uniref:Transcriptional regulator, AraC family n=1 Tax=Maridesulfovibrio salexigens (strain ATCC 14822 / DSM 2638 / NCIMB 8403 / VKM B-1763) TaxID=526222 RepID=C6BX37_MARSD|nr:AraC family transcriptional regulator [Maridesulfovibrio salexigens]ACS78517.1 transcriptional regulator, AraC family [Maridesulfovibrio salexigens DSM 2638]